MDKVYFKPKCNPHN